MRIAHRLATVAAVGAVAVGTVAVAPAAQADDLGTTSLATVLGVDGVVGNGFDSNWDDFDIVREAADAVIAAKGSSTPVALLGDGDVGADRVHPHGPRVPAARARPDGDLAERGQDLRRRGRASASTRSRPSCSTTWSRARSTPARPSPLTAPTVTTVQGGGITVDVRSTDPLRVRLVDQDPDALNPAADRRRPGHQRGQQADRPRDQPGAPAGQPLAVGLKASTAGGATPLPGAAPSVCPGSGQAARLSCRTSGPTGHVLVQVTSRYSHSMPTVVA